MASVASANRMVDAEVGTTAHVAPTAPIRLQLASAAGTSGAAGTAIANPAPANITFGAAANGVASGPPSAAISMTNTSGGAVTVAGVNIIDSAATPRFLGYGGLTGGSKTLNNNDVLSFAVNSVTYGVTPAP